MMGADADLRLIPDNDDVDFPELAALCLSEPPVPAPFDTVGSAAQEVRRVCKYSSCRSMGVGVCGGGHSARFALHANAAATHVPLGPGQSPPRAPGQVRCGAVRAGVPKRMSFGLLHAVP